ncbi:MAG: ATP-grasp domain-containing protein [Micrococcales bacterium]|nr:ATP-grasp domain-containing protein [Micrococcales bacterium]
MVPSLSPAQPAATPTRPLAVVVDPLSTGAALAGEFRRRGWRCVAVASIPWIADVVQADDFEEVLVDAPGTGLRERIRALAPDAVVPGAEFGVLLAEELARQQGLPVNLDLPGDPRRDKSTMLERLREQGVRAAAGRTVRSVDELDRWLSEWGRYPVVIKPARSAGSDGAQVCESREQALAAFETVAGQRNSLDLRNDGAVAMEYLDGQQFYANAVSIDGEHLVHEVWRVDVDNVDGNPLYDRDVSLAADDPLLGRLIAYTREVLTALGITDGASHSEIRMQGEQPVLVETGARLKGTSYLPAHHAVSGAHQVELLVERYAAPADFRARLAEPYRAATSCSCVALRVPRPSVVTAEGVAALAALPTAVGGPGLGLRAGQRVRQTTDLYTMPGRIYLVADDLSAIEADYRRIREIEQSLLYRPATPLEQRRWAAEERARWVAVRVRALPSWTARKVRERRARD